MKKFNAIYKNKQTLHENATEEQLLSGFKQVYNALLEQYSLTTVHDLDEKSQVAFMTELNQYWTEDKGITSLGESFINKRTLRLNENSTQLQRTNYLKSKATNIIQEIMRQTDTKYRLYGVIDEMYKQTKANNVSDVLSPDTIINTLVESFAMSIDDFAKQMYYELSESVGETVSNPSISKIDDNLGGGHMLSGKVDGKKRRNKISGNDLDKINDKSASKEEKQEIYKKYLITNYNAALDKKLEDKKPVNESSKKVFIKIKK